MTRTVLAESAAKAVDERLSRGWCGAAYPDVGDWRSGLGGGVRPYSGFGCGPAIGGGYSIGGGDGGPYAIRRPPEMEILP